MQRSGGGRTHSTCRHGLRRPPRSHMQRGGGGRTDGTCRHGLRRPPQSHMQRGGGGRTHGTCRHGLRRPPQSHMQRGGGGRTHGPVVMVGADRHGRTCSGAEVVAWTARHASRSRDSSSACDCTDGPVAMVGADRHSRTCSAAEVVARTALSSWSAQTATVVHAAERRWSHGRPCSHGRRRPPRSYMQRSGGGRTGGPVAIAGADRRSRTCSEAEVVAWTALSSWPAQTATVAHAAGRRWPHARPCSHGLGLRDGRRLGVARSAGHQRFMGLSCGAQLRPRERHCYAAASVGAHLQPHSRPSRLRYHIAAAYGRVQLP
jgi:hypothetical protein